MISSTVRDLSTHRNAVLDACLRVGVFPKMMEHLPATEMDASSTSMKLVDEADIYVGIFGYRYGYIPRGARKSISHMEFDRAVARGLPRLIFLMSDSHPVQPSDVERGKGAERIESFKNSIRNDHVVEEFSSVEELRTLVLDSLSRLKERVSDQSRSARTGKATGSLGAEKLFDSSKPLVLNPYSLLRAEGLVGRSKYLSRINDWFYKKSDEHPEPIMLITAVGGMGKSALTWSWFKSLPAGGTNGPLQKIWWSFYEPTATFQRFVGNSLAYLTKTSSSNVMQNSLEDQLEELYVLLDQKRILIVLDGIERLLRGYDRGDHDDADENSGPPSRQFMSQVEKSTDLRETILPQVGRFLRKLSQLAESRILVNSRVVPKALELIDGRAIGGCRLIQLEGLDDEESLQLWRANGGAGKTQSALRIFNSFGNHALVIQILASEVARFRSDPGNIDAWLESNSNLDPMNVPLDRFRSLILDRTLRNLNDAEKQTLRIIAGTRLASSWETLKSLLVGDQHGTGGRQPPFQRVSDLESVLSTLEDRGLIGWDRANNAYEMHPLIRGATLNSLDENTRRGVYQTLEQHFQAMPRLLDYRDVMSLDDLTPQIERIHSLASLGRFDEAFQVMLDEIDHALLYKLGATRDRQKLIDLFHFGYDQKRPPTQGSEYQFYTLNAMGQGAQFAGDLESAEFYFGEASNVSRQANQLSNLSTSLCNRSYVCLFQGRLALADKLAREALNIDISLSNPFDEACSLHALSRIHWTIGNRKLALAALSHCEVIRIQQNDSYGSGRTQLEQAYFAFSGGDVRTASELLSKFDENPHKELTAIEHLRRMRLVGAVNTKMRQFDKAMDVLQSTLVKAHSLGFLEEELQLRVLLFNCETEMSGQISSDNFDELCKTCERTGFRLILTTLMRINATMLLRLGNQRSAEDAALKAFTLAQCDGQPYVFKEEIDELNRIFVQLGKTAPQIPSLGEEALKQIPRILFAGWDEE